MDILKSKPLPYTMGNAGDLIKHGLISEFLDWHLKSNYQDEMIFYDPFGGRPWQEPVHAEVKTRVESLSSCALKSVQMDINERYLGSGHIIQSIGKINQTNTKIFSSDRDEVARLDLNNSGLELITLDGFDPGSGYSILESRFPKNKEIFILMDPFYDLQKINDSILQQIVDLVLNQQVIIALYVLYKGENLDLWYEFKKLNSRLTKDQLNYHSLLCKKINNSPIEGESNYHSFVSLYMDKSFVNGVQEELVTSISDYATNLSHVLDADVKYSYQLMK